MVLSVAPQARLQRLILFALAGGSAPTIVSLASRVGATRPSVSRSLKALATRGYVESRGRSWLLTNIGWTEVQSARSSFTPAVERALLRQSAVENRMGLTVGALARGFAGFGKTLAMQSPLPRGFDIAKGLAMAQLNVFDSLRVQMVALSSAPNWSTAIVADNLGITARIAADVATIRNALPYPSEVARARSIGIQTAVGRVVGTHHDHLIASMPTLLTGFLRPDAPSLLVSPTAAAEAFTATARGMIVPPAPQGDSADKMRAGVWDLAERLERTEATAAARDLRAAWDVVKHRRPGWSKAGPHLMRESLREALDVFAPPSQVPADQKGLITKRAQVLSIVGGNDTLAIFVEVTANSVGRLHSLLSAEAKNAEDPRVGWQGLLGLLETTMGLLRILIDHAERHSN